MAEPEKISKELEEQIQSFAGDIYIQVEDKITSLVADLSSQHTEITSDAIEQHQH